MREERVLFLDDGLPVVTVLGLLVRHVVDVLLLQDVLTLQRQSGVVVSSIAGVDVALLEVMLISIADEGLVQVSLLRHA